MCSAHHSKKPTLSRISEIMIMAINDNVAFQTIPVTVQTSLSVTTLNSRAKPAPTMADQPIDKPLGCQITNKSVNKKMLTANVTCIISSYVSRKPFAFSIKIYACQLMTLYCPADN
ncbi:hypothetical protein FC56_GL001509 [Lentilactobacillus senioris DSM 24302 = JCM 17472]|uniref:Uncharacterized protein n=1 Tax=Lentilactobacillus senioris DSM 24302 = JCM 17472 TaxID=1423802 RepID=A0A0R2CSE9_9LACO|nr:hypothetical protein FC56_GL001509 [Lentilactobacillus senioris DSM 24302 = JCM 17472]